MGYEGEIIAFYGVYIKNLEKDKIEKAREAGFDVCVELERAENNVYEYDVLLRNYDGEEYRILEKMNTVVGAKLGDSYVGNPYPAQKVVQMKKVDFTSVEGKLKEAGFSTESVGLYLLENSSYYF